jgi:two-component system, response regulator PdtaR
LRVVVVEDEAIIAMELEDLLAELGAEVVGTAPSAARAIELARTLRPDCMTMDIRIQGARDGISAAIEIYESFGIRSAFVSAFGNPETAARAKAAHPLGWVPKPIRKADLAAVLGGVPRGGG